MNGIISWNQINLTTKFLINLSIIQRIWNQNNQQWKGFNLARYRIILINTFWSIFYKKKKKNIIYNNFSEKKKKKLYDKCFISWKKPNVKPASPSILKLENMLFKIKIMLFYREN